MTKIAIQAELPPDLTARTQTYVKEGWATDFNELLVVCDAGEVDFILEPVTAGSFSRKEKVFLKPIKVPPDA